MCEIIMNKHNSETTIPYEFLKYYSCLVVLQGKVMEGTEEPVDWSFAVLELLREEQGLDIQEMNNR